jgi:hypothetical protein
MGFIIGADVGSLLGDAHGGNYAVEFEFAGVRGYEATSLIGAIIGALFSR